MFPRVRRFTCSRTAGRAVLALDREDGGEGLGAAGVPIPVHRLEVGCEGDGERLRRLEQPAVCASLRRAASFAASGNGSASLTSGDSSSAPGSGPGLVCASRAAPAGPRAGEDRSTGSRRPSRLRWDAHHSPGKEWQGNLLHLSTGSPRVKQACPTSLAPPAGFPRALHCLGRPWQEDIDAHGRRSRRVSPWRCCSPRPRGTGPGAARRHRRCTRSLPAASWRCCNALV